MALTPKARLAALALAQGASQEEAARRAGIAVRTLRYWLADGPELRAEVARITEEIVAQEVAGLVGLLGKARARLTLLIDNPDPRVATRAVRIVYATYMGMRTHGEVTTKLDEIRETLRHGDKGGWDDEADDDSTSDTGTDGPEPDAPEG